LTKNALLTIDVNVSIAGVFATARPLLNAIIMNAVTTLATTAATAMTAAVWILTVSVEVFYKK
jgi:hypothetical protein